jgi:small GTP-binding protein
MQAMIGCYFKAELLIPVGDQNINLQVWDPCGMERFRSITRAYFRNTFAGILLYDIKNDESFHHLEQWLQDFQENCLPNTYVILVGNKADLRKERKVEFDQAKEFAEIHGIDFLEISARSKANLLRVFTKVACELVKKTKLGQFEGIRIPGIQNNGIDVSQSNREGKC